MIGSISLTFSPARLRSKKSLAAFSNRQETDWWIGVHCCRIVFSTSSSRSVTQRLTALEKGELNSYNRMAFMSLRPSLVGDRSSSMPISSAVSGSYNGIITKLPTPSSSICFSIAVFFRLTVFGKSGIGNKLPWSSARRYCDPSKSEIWENGVVTSTRPLLIIRTWSVLSIPIKVASASESRRTVLNISWIPRNRLVLSIASGSSSSCVTLPKTCWLVISVARTIIKPWNSKISGGNSSVSSFKLVTLANLAFLPMVEASTSVLAIESFNTETLLRLERRFFLMMEVNGFGSPLTLIWQNRASHSSL